MKTILRDGSGRERHYRFILEDRDRHGNARIYFRRPGAKMVRLRMMPGTLEFDREYEALYSGTAPVAVLAPKAARVGTKAGTLGALIEAYYQRGMVDLDSSTQRVKRSILDEIAAKLGDEPVAALEPRHIAALRDEKKAQGLHEAGNKRVKDMRALFRWASDPEVALTHHNPAATVRYLSPKNKDGHHTWTVEEIEQYQARWPLGTKARLALDLFLYTGVRISDVILLGRQMARRGPDGDNLIWLHFTEFKNRNNAPKLRDIPILPILQESIDATPSRNLRYLVTGHDRPYASAKAFANRFKSWCEMAGLPARCTAHGLRKGGATIAVENGATEHQLMAIYGWQSLKQAQLYTRKYNRKKVVKGAMPLLEIKQKSNITVAPFAPVEAGATISANKSKKSKRA